MDAIQILGTTLGLGVAAGMRLYATVLALGLAMRYDWLTLPEQMRALQVLEHPAILITAGVMYVMEFVSDKIPWVDSAWDAVHTFIRPVGAAALAWIVLGEALGPVQFLGGLLILAGIFAARPRATSPGAAL